MKKIAKRKKKKLIQAIKVPLMIGLESNGKKLLIPNNDPYAGKTKFIKHQPTVTGSSKF